MGLFDRLKNKVMDYVDSTIDVVNSVIGKYRQPELITGNVIDINQRLRERDIVNQRYTQSRGIDYAKDYSLPEPREVVEDLRKEVLEAREEIERLGKELQQKQAGNVVWLSE